MEVEMSQSPVTCLEIDDEDILLVSKDASPMPQRKLKRLKRAGQAPGNDRRQVPLSDQNKIADEGNPMDYMNANEIMSNVQGFTTGLEQIQNAEEQCIVQNSFCNQLDEVDKEDGQKEDHQADNVHTGTGMLGTINTFMDISAPEKGKDNESLKVTACTNEHIMEATEESQVANSYTEIESLKVKNKSRKSTHEKDKHNKKLKKNPVSTDEFMVEASDDLQKAASCSLEKEKKKKKKKKGSQDKSKPSSESLNTVEKKRDKKKNKSNLEEIHAESQRLLRETPNASFKPQLTVGKSISSVLEKIRLRKLQLEQKAGKGSSGVLESSGDDTSSEDLEEESQHTSLSEGDEDEDEPLKEMPQMENEERNSEEVGSRVSLADESGIPQTPDNHGETSLCEKGTRQDNAKTNGVFRAPVEDTQDLFCNSELSSGEDQEENPDDSTQEDDIFVPTLSNMNLKLDSHPDDDELFDEGENKENVDPSSSKPVETSVYSKGASVKAFVDDEAEDEDEDILVRHDEDDNSEEDENEDLKDLVATAEEEQPVDHWKRDELHRKWLEEQDSAETGDILLRLGCGWRQKGARKPALLGEDDDDAFDDDEDDIVECDDRPGHHSLVSQESEHGDDDSNMEAQPLKPIVDEDDVYESSDDEELEERLMRQRVLEESEEQEVFLSPEDDETSREVFGLIKKVNVAPTVKKKPKPSSTFHEIIGSGGNSNSSSKSSFLGRTTNSSLQISHKQGLGSSRFYIFGRDDSNSGHAVSKSESQEDMDQKENKHSADNLNKMSSTQNKAKQNEPGNKTANNKTDSSMGPSLFQILRRQTSEIDRTLQSRNTNGDEENKQAYSMSHFAAFKSFRSVKTLKRTG